MIIRRLVHVGTFAFPDREILLEVETLPTIVGLCGSNGAGKSTLLELILAATHLVMPSRPGALHRNFKTKGFIDLTFDMDGRTYRSLVHVDPDTERTEASLFDATGALLAGPLVKEFKRATEALIGPLDVLLASMMSVQSGIGAFLRLPRADRKALLVELLGLQRFTALEARCKDRGRTAEITLTTGRARCAELDAQVGQQTVLETESAATRGHLAEAERRLAEVGPRLDAVRRELQVVEVERAGVAALASQATACGTEVRTLTDRLADTTTRLEHNRALLDRAPAIQGAVTQDAALTDALRTLEMDLDAARTAQQAGHAAAQRGALVVRDLTHAEGECTRLTGQLARLATVPCRGEGAYAACPLLTDAQAARVGLPTATARVTALRAQIPVPGPTPPDPTPALRARKAALDTARAGLTGLVAMIGPLAAAEARVTELADQGSHLAADLQSARDRLATFAGLPARMAELDTARRTAQQAVQTVVDAQRTAQQAVTQWTHALGQLEGRLATVREAEQALDVVRAALGPLEADVADWALLATAFGPNGIPALLIDQALPELGALATDLLETCYGERVFMITLSTQRESAAGDKRLETLDVIVTRGGAPLDAALLSGGEAVLVSEALALALALYTASRSGRRLQTLLRDEVSAPLDRDRAPAYVTMLRRAAALGDFRTVLFVSHQERAVELADAQLEVGGGALHVG